MPWLEGQYHEGWNGNTLNNGSIWIPKFAIIRIEVINNNIDRIYLSDRFINTLLRKKERGLHANNKFDMNTLCILNNLNKKYQKYDIQLPEVNLP